ncbi:MAG TPA: hypothetical protein VK783_09665 [Bacteroidia bacterium]|jgi:hypothetical protein|nr:hypothetical protein [Bacteroidia bacterium]
MGKTINQCFLFVLLCFSCLQAHAQSYYSEDKKTDKKYYIAFSYGVGSARWYSQFYDSPLYNLDGSVLKYGNLKLQATNPVYDYDFSVCAPVGKIRLGAGIRFEKFSMDKLSLISSDSSGTNVTNNYLLFTENFWFNEIFAMVQIPFSFCSGKSYSLEYDMNAGFYGYNGIRHLNFFGDDQIASTYHVSAGFLLDYEVIDNIRVFIHPEFEYKYFHNNPNESPSVIIHNIYTGILSFGIRGDISKI